MNKSDRDISQWDARLKQQLERSFHNYHKRRIDLSVARDNKQFNWTGEILIVEKASSSTAIATVRLMFDDADELTLEENIEINSIFNRLYISNEAQAGEWLDVIAGINFEYKKKIAEGFKYVDRGNLATPDFELVDFIRDSIWHELDLSGIVPKNTVIVNIRITCRETVSDSQCLISTNGLASGFNGINAWTQSTTSYLCIMGEVTPNANRGIYYKFESGTWDFIEFVIRGYWIK